MDERLTNKRVLLAWWAMQWRAVLATFLGSFVLIVVFSFFAALLGVNKESIMIAGNLIYSGVAIFASIYFFGFTLRKDHGSFRFALVEKEEERSDAEVPPGFEEANAEASSERRDSVLDSKNISKERE